MLNAVLIVTVSGVGVLALMRYRVLRGPIAYGTCMGLAAFGSACPSLAISHGTASGWEGEEGRHCNSDHVP